ncbi:hypothetical protein HBHAL_5077 [Halobacillus halophilus DSM 2266]|uniref:Uncharacterized protein n=1 Tax=Halobacillus halophilus (strain ATCC 35676 / DSM 2266 / JCM 20832 / KCTC 3685 / LMG 17431 / NBRC 102448 / NCIMB 2269) TaxID=866895 RepID=I0JTE0_HALH3|nr:hypothetical protein HBHAL_5077 [Halobacillus halophilus DSM 2266]
MIQCNLQTTKISEGYMVSGGYQLNTLWLDTFT